MLNQIVKWSIAQRWLIIIASLLISLWGWRVLGGLFTSTALTLLVLPALYALFGKFIVEKKLNLN
jgi:Cu/Ag efflux pump CusA